MLAMSILALGYHLLPATIAGFTVYILVESISEKLVSKISGAYAKVVAVAVVGLMTISVLNGIILYVHSFLSSGNDNISLLLAKIVEILQSLKNIIPANIQEHIPATAIEAKESLIHQINSNMHALGELGKNGLKQIVHILMGMVIGAIVSFYNFIPHANGSPLLVQELKTRVSRFKSSFQKIVFSQVKISGINTVFTGIFLAIGLPVFGIEMPYVKTLIFITFISGLIPVLGNLISNTIIFLVALSVSVYAGGAAIVFLIVIHKLEYFINAKIIGSQVNSTAWELLLAMLIMEALFGVPGIVAAPILYAYIKNELASYKLI